MRWKPEIKEMNFKKTIVEKYVFILEKIDFQKIRFQKIIENLNKIKISPKISETGSQDKCPR